MYPAQDGQQVKTRYTIIFNDDIVHTCVRACVRACVRVCVCTPNVFHCYTPCNSSVQPEATGRGAALPHQDEGGEKGKRKGFKLFGRKTSKQID